MHLQWRRAGFSLTEVLVSMGIITAGVLAWAAFQGYIGKTASKAMVTLTSVSEIRTASGMVEGISKPSAIRAARLDLTGSSGCLPHPYSILVNTACRNAKTVNFDPTSPRATAALSAWEKLSEAVLSWPNAGIAGRESVIEVLDASHFQQKVVPALRDAGCLHCHGPLTGSTRNYSVAGQDMKWAQASDLNLGPETLRQKPEIALRDFSSFDDMTLPFSYRRNEVTETAPPLATLAILSSKLGESLLRREVELHSGTASGLLVKSRVFFDVEEFSTAVQLKRSTQKSRDNFECSCPAPATKTDRDPSLACRSLLTTEPAASDDPSRYACSAGEEYVSGSCQETCIRQTSPPICGCGKGCSMICSGWVPRCAQYQVRYTCQSNAAQSESAVSKAAEGVPFGTGSTLETQISNQLLQQALDSRCLSLGSDCQSRPCSSVGTGDYGKCILENSCKVRCTSPVMAGGYSCGKGCFVPAYQAGCREVNYAYTCVSPNQMLEISTELAKFTISTTRFERDSNGQLRARDTQSLQGILE